MKTKKNRLVYFLILILGSVFPAFGQRDSEKKCLNPDFEKTVDRFLSYSVPVVTIEDAKAMTEDVIFLDARELEEYEVSHLPGARYIGYDGYDISKIKDLEKDQKIIVYCSIGYRSEKIGKKLQKAGFTDVYNLFGSIFEWANQGHTLYDNEGNPTKKVHTYNKKWSKWVEEGAAEKVW